MITLTKAGLCREGTDLIPALPQPGRPVPRRLPQSAREAAVRQNGRGGVMPRVRLGRSLLWRQAAVWGLPLVLLLSGLSLGGAVGHVLLALGIVLPIALHGTVALRGIDPHLVEMARNYGLHRRMLLRRVILPGAWPQLRLGLRQTLFLLWLALLLHALILAQEGMGQAIALCVLGAVLTDGLLRAAPAGQSRRALARPEGV